MAKFTLPHFGELDMESLEEYYIIEIELEGRAVEIDLNFDEMSVEVKKMENIKMFIDKIVEFDKKNLQYIEKDYHDEEGDTVREYIELHLKDMPRKELTGLVDFDNTKVKPADQLFKQLKLVRMGLYPDNEDGFAVFDYSLGADFTNYLVVVNINENGRLDYLTMES